MKLCFLLWSLIYISCQFIWITVYAMDSLDEWFHKRDALGKCQKKGLLGPPDDYSVKPLQG